jgi:putative sigma-54 modulation protein
MEATMTQKLEVVGHNMEVKDRLQEYVEKKASKLDRYLPLVDEIRIELEHNKSARSAKSRYITQITVRGKGVLLRVEERADDIRPAFDEALDKMQRQMERYKGKHYHSRGNGKSVAEVLTVDAIPQARIKPSIISRRKTFEILPMDEAEALDQMKMLGHDNFFIFFNIKTTAVSVLYRRRDGTYGLIEPVVR